MQKTGSTRQIPFGVFLLLLAFGAALFVSLLLTIGFWSTIGFYGLCAFLFAILIWRAPINNDDN